MQKCHFVVSVGVIRCFFIHRPNIDVKRLFERLKLAPPGSDLFFKYLNKYYIYLENCILKALIV